MGPMICSYRVCAAKCFHPNVVNALQINVPLCGGSRPLYHQRSLVAMPSSQLRRSSHLKQSKTRFCADRVCIVKGPQSNAAILAEVHRRYSMHTARKGNEAHGNERTGGQQISKTYGYSVQCVPTMAFQPNRAVISSTQQRRSSMERLQAAVSLA